jgi:hypothetical protein
MKGLPKKAHPLSLRISLIKRKKKKKKKRKTKRKEKKEKKVLT